MKSDLARATLDTASSMLENGAGLTELLPASLDILAEGHPCPLWERYHTIHVAPEVAAVSAAIDEQLSANPVPPELDCVWFGLYELSSSASDAARSVIALEGGRFGGWDQFLSEHRWEFPGYLPTPQLSAMAEPAFGDEDAYWLVTYALTLVYCLGLVTDVLRTPISHKLLSHQTQVRVLAGFHDGDIADLGALTRGDGLVVNENLWT